MFKAALVRKPGNKPALKGLSELRTVLKVISVARKQLEAVIGDGYPLLLGVRLTHALL